MRLKIPLVRSCILVILILGWCISFAQSPRTFYIGHSLSDQIPDMVQSLSDDHDEVDFSWVYQSIPGAPLHWQWARKDANDYTNNPPQFYGFYDPVGGLPAGDFDVLVLTEAVPRYPALIDETYEFADSFYNYATTYNPNLRVYLYEDWHCILSGTPTGCDYDVDSNPWRQRLDDDLSMWESVVDTLNQRYNPSTPVCLIPGGQGLAALYDSIQVGAVPGITMIEDVFSDNIHLNDTGKYYIACIHFAMLHEVSPVGLTNQLQHWWGGNLGAPDPNLALKLQEIAWEVVNTYPRTCLNTTTAATDVSLEANCLSILPNPTDDIFEIDGLLGDYSIDILDGNGAIYQTLSNMGDRVEVDIQGLPSGLYYIRIVNMTNQSISIEKVLKFN